MLQSLQFPDQRLGTDHRNIIWNNRKGFVIRSPTFYYIGLFSCETIINGTKYTNQFLTYRPGTITLLTGDSWANIGLANYWILMFVSLSPVNKIQKVYLNSTGLERTLKGERLALNCTVTAELNSRVSISWSYPRKVSQPQVQQNIRT